MTSITGPIKVAWQQSGSATALARVCARDATGAWTGIVGEGNWLKQADLAVNGITCAVYDRNGAAPDTAIANPTVTISSAIQDIPITDGKIWDIDTIGYNFLHDLTGTSFPTGGHKYRVEYTFTTTGGTTWTLPYEGVAEGVVG